MAYASAVILLGLALLSSTGCRTAASAGRDMEADEPARRIAAAFESTRGNKRALTAALVELLGDESLAVRYYAIGALSRQTGTTMGYHYAAPPEIRDAAAARWHRYVEETEPGRP